MIKHKQALIGLLAGAAQLRAQDTTTVARQAPAPVATWRDAAVGAAFLAGAALLIPADRSIEKAAQGHALQNTPVFHHAADAFNALADPGTLILAGGTWLGGLVFHQRRVAALGLHVGEGLIVAAAITEGLKGVAGRARPFVDPTHSLDFRFGRGFSNDNYASFPSGEVTLAFAAASGVTAETARWPGSTPWVGPVSYGVAGLVGLSRIYQNQHWASDVVTGAGIGALSGLLVVRWNAAHPRNFIDRLLLPAAVAPTSHRGVAIMWSAH
jgi:membrane-associated phospholipid phosphatase